MSVKHYHFIAIGGAVMHQLALHLHNMGNIVTGSDDAIFDPAYTNLQSHGILPDSFGWNSNRIHDKLDAVILGMHAQKDNPELLKAQELGVKIYSFPEFVYEQSTNKKRVVIAGSHGKTTTTSMIMHVLHSAGKDFDYLVGAQIEGFDYVVKTSATAPIIVIEGDEYLTSPLDLRSKFLHYHPDIAIITGVAWDHINVFPTYPEYVETFRKFVQTVKDKIFYYFDDQDLQTLAGERHSASMEAYHPLKTIQENDTVSIDFNGHLYPIQIFGEHNMSNLSAALKVCIELGITEEEFFDHIQSFKGAAKRMELLHDDMEQKITLYKDFAHAPSKVKATVKAIRERYPDRKLITALELHTYSSLQKNFIEQYKFSLDVAESAAVYVDSEALKLKKREAIDSEWLKDQFGNPNIFVPSNSDELKNWLKQEITPNSVVLLMSSGHWGGMDLKSLN